QRVGDPLDVVRQRVRHVVHRVDLPPVARAVVRRVHDPVEDRVAHLHVRRGEVDLRAQHVRALLELARLHALEQVEVLLDAAVAVGARAARLRDGAAQRPDLLLGGGVDVGEALADQLERPAVELREVVGGEAYLDGLEAEPRDVADRRLDVAHLLGLGARVVDAQVGHAAVCRGDADAQAERLRVAGREGGAPSGAWGRCPRGSWSLLYLLAAARGAPADRPACAALRPTIRRAAAGRAAGLATGAPRRRGATRP